MNWVRDKIISDRPTQVRGPQPTVARTIHKNLDTQALVKMRKDFKQLCQEAAEKQGRSLSYWIRKSMGRALKEGR